MILQKPRQPDRREHSREGERQHYMRCYGCQIPITSDQAKTYVDGNPVHNREACIQEAQRKVQAQKDANKQLKR